ncbi:hypothetical protein PDQ69_21700 [Bacillus cereus group sp. Bc062]|uniref:hypothetical protein n=1 Tax=Bacillus cereus group sp. Bc062 TaxID=3018116 RepID=UPI0022E3D359|nr:hypothetical protein [Bacillus cereus group sp. Bc062]MDA2587731.1 hypothetical protein [Bacillus cereus group sp. Bc062]
MKQVIESIYIHVAVKIDTPKNLHEYSSSRQEEFSFDKNNRFTDYTKKNSDISFLTLDDNNQWYYITNFEINNFSELKLARQIFIPPYLNQGISLPLIKQLNSEHLIPKNQGYDKAYAHVSIKTKELSSLSPIQQSKLANVDGDDDPIVSSNLHYISNIYNNTETRFVSGIETNSFATLTENEDYYRNIHLPNVSTLYLKYFVYFREYGFVPSMQMMPKLLNNLWLSTQANKNDWNKSLLKIIPLNN